MSRKWTEDQLDAIRARGGTLLVSAAAGSGKTAVLVQRVIERITDEKTPSDADRLLVVTFTRAAAAEMRNRIETELSRLLEADPANTRLQRQQILFRVRTSARSTASVPILCGRTFTSWGFLPTFAFWMKMKRLFCAPKQPMKHSKNFMNTAIPPFISSWNRFRPDATTRQLGKRSTGYMIL